MLRIASLFLFVSFCWPRSSFAQDINKILTDKDAQTFLQKNYPKEYGDFIIGHIFLRKKERQYATDIGLKNFYKVDFDKNGYTDLLISGILPSRDSNPEVIVILADSVGKYKPYRLTNYYRTRKWPAAIVKKINNENLIVYQELYDTESDDDQKVKRGFSIDYKKYELSLIYSDTLICKWGQFVNYQAPERVTTKSICGLYYLSRPTMCIGRNPRFDLSIDSVGNTILNISRANELPDGTYHCKLGKPYFRRLTDVINYVNIFRYEDEYLAGVTDLTDAILEVAFTDGSRKKIHDYGKIGGFGLQFLYKFFDQMRLSQFWQRER